MNLDEDMHAIDPEELERERDVATALAWFHEIAQGDAAAYQDDRFVEWLARDARTRARRTVDWTDERVRQLADGMRARVLAAQLGVRSLEGDRVIRSADPQGPVLKVLDRAAEMHCAVSADLGVAAGAGNELWDLDCDEWVQLPTDIPRGRYVALTVKGDSMLPLLHSGDVVLVRISQACATDSVVVARRPEDGHVVKRVGRIGRTRVELLSLNEGFAPISIPRQSDLIVGTVIARWCAHASPNERVA